MQNKNILVWLPSPMGDAILCTPALRAIRERFKSSTIHFLARPIVRDILSPNSFNDIWLDQQSRNPFAIASALKKYDFTHAILFKNSFASALSVFLAKIPVRIGYSREGRGFLLTDKLYPAKLTDGGFKPTSMVDYYLAIAAWLGADTDNRKLQLLIDQQSQENIKTKLPEIISSPGLVVILVPGGAFGPSKCWPIERFAQTADWLIDNFNATVVISVSSDDAEKKIAKEICQLCKHVLINLAEKPVSLGELKAVFSKADLVITNDTGPRHIAIALERKVISLFGPNDPAWTNTGYENEIQLIGDAPCGPCDKPKCSEEKHFCMEAITVDMVCETANKLLKDNLTQPTAKTQENFVETAKSFFINPDYKKIFAKSGLTSIEGIFSFSGGKNLGKSNLARFRSRIRFEINSPSATLFLKRYNKPPITVQLKNWLSHRKRISCSLCDVEPTVQLATAGINTPKTICFGQQWGVLFEKRSFSITEKIPDAESLEKKLPDYFNGTATAEKVELRKDFIARLAGFVKKFHETGYRHRDLYFSHIFYNSSGQFYLIDLARVFKPRVFSERFRIKDIAQLFYSAPGKYFSHTDRLRFYLALYERKKLTKKDKAFIKKVVKKTKRMARHDIKHDRGD